MLLSQLSQYPLSTCPRRHVAAHRACRTRRRSGACRLRRRRNLRWRHVDVRTDRQGRPFVCINVRGKGKFRELVAAQNVASYLDRIKAISKATKPDDFVFTTHTGKFTSSLYGSLIESLLKDSGLLHSSSGSRRSSYCFRHTYATFRLMEGVDVYFLAKQMGTSVKMIEDYYGHITPAKNAERILQGIPGWEPTADASGETPGGVNAAGAGSKKAARPRTRPPTAGRIEARRALTGSPHFRPLLV
jgi:integrase